MPPIFHLDESMLLLEVVWSEVGLSPLVTLTVNQRGHGANRKSSGSRARERMKFAWRDQE